MTDRSKLLVAVRDIDTVIQTEELRKNRLRVFRDRVRTLHANYNSHAKNGTLLADVQDLMDEFTNIEKLGKPHIPPSVQAIYASGEFTPFNSITGKLDVDYMRYFTLVGQFLESCNHQALTKNVGESLSHALKVLERLCNTEDEIINRDRAIRISLRSAA